MNVITIAISVESVDTFFPIHIDWLAETSDFPDIVASLPKKAKIIMPKTEVEKFNKVFTSTYPKGVIEGNIYTHNALAPSSDFRSSFLTSRPTASAHVDKETAKYELCNKYIADGAPNSTARFVKDFYDSFNVSKNFVANDFVYISTNGRRSGAVLPVVNGKLQGDYKRIDSALENNCYLVADTINHIRRTKDYNIGEALIAEYLQENGAKIVYSNNLFAVWHKP